MASSKNDEEAGSSPSPCPSHEGDFPSLLTRRPLSSLAKTFANLVLCIIGSGVLGLPYTFSRVGWVMGIFMLVASGALSYHGMMLQVYSKHSLHRSQHGANLVINSYGDLAYHAFGSWGALAVDVLLILGSLASGIARVTFISKNAVSIASDLQRTQLTHAMGSYNHGISLDLPNISNLYTEARENNTFWHGNLSEFSLQNQSLPNVSQKVFANLSFSGASPPDGILGGLSWLSTSTYTCIVFPFEVALSTIPSVTLLAPFSVVGDTLNFGALAAVMVSDVMTIQKTSSFRDMKAFGSILAVPSAFGVGVYAFIAAGITIPIEAAMKDPLRYGSVMKLAFLVSGVLYAMFAMLGYAAFGANTQQVITLNLSSGIEAMVIKVAMCFSFCLAIPLALNPVFELVERRFSQRKVSWVLRSLIVFVVCFLATTVKQFTTFLSLAGSSTFCLSGFILPAAIHFKVMKDDVDQPLNFLLNAADILLIVFGVIFGAFGTTVSIIELIG